MKLFNFKPLKTIAAQADQPAAKLDRRSLVLGTGVAGVAAVAAHALHQGATVAPAAALAANALPQAGDGYQVTQHVLRYYETAKV